VTVEGGSRAFLPCLGRGHVSVIMAKAAGWALASTPVAIYGEGRMAGAQSGGNDLRQPVATLCAGARRLKENALMAFR